MSSSSETTALRQQVKPIALFYLRRNRGWSQQYLADLIGVTRVYVSLVESGREPASSRFRVACSELFDAPEWIVFGVADHERS